MTTLQVGVKAFLKNKEGKFLLLKRNGEKYNTKGSWDIVGGRIDAGTPLIENLKREVQEETQLMIVSEPKLIAAQDILRVQDKHVVRLSYIAECEGEIILDTSENTEYKWMTINEIQQLEDVDMYVEELVKDASLFE
jgi:ADP-ribose pyrophosphatase YjhB (NUDIX family)